jgi:hypothetical protein
MADQYFTLTQEYLKDVYEYQDGELIRKHRQGNKQAGTTVGCMQKIGYKITVINKKFFYLHRLIFMFHNGYMPLSIDHIDGNKSNNKIENLRPCNASENLSNRSNQSNSKSGHKNVYWLKNRSQWVVALNAKNKKYHIGYYNDINQAIQAASTARLNLHGNFARP